MANRYGNLDGTRRINETYTQINEGFTRVQADVDAGKNKAEGIQTDITTHKVSATAHAAEHITYEGPVVGAEDLKSAVDSVKQQLDTAVMAGDSGAAAAQAAIDVEGVDHRNLKTRIDSDVIKLNTQLAETVTGVVNGNLMFALVGDGSADNSIALQQAIDYTIENGGVLSIAPGIYDFNATITVTSDLHIIGISEKGINGRGVYLRYTGSETAFKIGKYDGTYIYGMKLMGVRLGAKTTAAVGIEIDRLSECEFSDIHFNGALGTAMLVRGLTLSIIEKCDFSANRIGIHWDADGSTKPNVSNSVKENNFFANTICDMKINKVISLRVQNNWAENSPCFIWIDNDSVENFASVNNLDIMHNDVSLVAISQTRALKLTNTVSANLIAVANLKLKSNRFYMGSTNNSSYNVEMTFAANTNAGTFVTGIIADNEMWGAEVSGIVSDTNKSIITIANNDVRSGFGTSIRPQTSGSVGIYRGLSHTPGFDYSQVIGGPLLLGTSQAVSPIAGMMRYNSGANTIRLVNNSLSEAELGSRVAVPSSATATGSIGQWAVDASFFYVCSSINTWRRVAIASW